MKKVLLINPEFNIVKDNYDSSVSVGLLSIATYLHSQNVEVKVIDGVREKDYLNLIDQQAVNYDIIGLSVMTMQISNALAACEIIRRVNPQAMIVWGGSHGTFFPEQTAVNKLIDVVCFGEGELTMLDLATGKPLAEIPGIYYCENGEIKKTSERPLHDPAQMPLFNWRLVPETIRHQLYLVPSLTSRGCPHRCTFCINAILKNRWRFRTVEQVLEDVSIIKSQEYFKDKKIRFWDENFFVDIKRAKAIVDGMIERGLTMPWETTIRAGYIRPGMVDDDFMAKLKLSGCYLLSFGAESGSPRVLKMIKKDVTPDEIVNSAKMCIKHGIIPQYSFMIGLPGEEKSDMLLTLKLIDRLVVLGGPVEILGPQAFRPYPGSELYLECLRSGWREPQTLEDWKRVSEHELSYMSVKNFPWVKDKDFVESMEAYVRFGALNFSSAMNSTITSKKWLKFCFIVLCKIRWKLKFFAWPIEFKLAKKFVTQKQPSTTVVETDLIDQSIVAKKSSLNLILGFIKDLTKWEKIWLLLISFSFFWGITYGFPSTVAVMDEMYFVGGVIRSMQQHSILPQGLDVPYGTINYFVSYIFISAGLLALLPFFGFNFGALQNWSYLNSYYFYLAPRLVSVMAGLGLLYLLYRLLHQNWSNRYLRLGMISLLFTNLLFSSLIRTGKVWMLSTFLIFLSFYCLYRVMTGEKRLVLATIVFSALAFSNFPLAGLSLVAWPIVWFFSDKLQLSRRQIINYFLVGLAIVILAFLFNGSGIKAQIFSIVNDYTLSPDAIAKNLSVFSAAYIYAVKFLFVFAPILLAGLFIFAGIKNKKLFGLSLFYFVIYFLALIVVARWTDGMYSFLRYLCPLGVFLLAIISSLKVTENRFRRQVFFALVFTNLVYFGFFSLKLFSPTTFIMTRDWFSANANAKEIMIVNRVGAKLDLPLNRQSALALQEQFCGSRCDYVRRSSEYSSFYPLVISEESLPQSECSGEVYYVFDQPQNTTDLELVTSFASPQNYGFEHSLDTIGDYFDPTFFSIRNLGSNIFIYHIKNVAGQIPYLPKPHN